MKVCAYGGFVVLQSAVILSFLCCYRALVLYYRAFLVFLSNQTNLILWKCETLRGGQNAQFLSSCILVLIYFSMQEFFG